MLTRYSMKVIIKMEDQYIFIFNCLYAFRSCFFSKLKKCLSIWAIWIPLCLWKWVKVVNQLLLTNVVSINYAVNKVEGILKNILNFFYRGSLKPSSYKSDKIISLNGIFSKRKLPMPLFFQKKKQKNELSS